MRAASFRAWAGRESEPAWSVRIHRPLEDSHGIYRFGVGLYNWIQRTAPALHHLYFNFLERVPIIRARSPLGAARYRAVLEDVRPDVVLSVHDSLNHGFFAYARRVLGEANVRCVTYCGELAGGYGFSRHWVNPAADLFIGAVPETCAAAVALGMDRRRTVSGGFLLRPEFYEPEPTAEQRAEMIQARYGFDPARWILLLSASSRGANNHLAFLEALESSGAAVQVIALCGRSDTTRARVAAWQAAHPSFPLRIESPDANMAELMRLVSAVVARPGTGTTSEAIVCRAPLLLNCLGGVMPQEQLTVRFCQGHDIARVIRSPGDLATRLAAWSDDSSEMQSIRQRMITATPLGHPSEIVDRLRFERES